MTRRRFRRVWLALVSALVLTPLAVMILSPERARVSEEEMRDLAAAPAWPARFDDWMRLPRATDAWLGDRFGLRRALVHARAALIHDWLRGGTTERVLVAHDGRLILRGEGALPQSAGRLLRGAALTRTADLIAEVRTLLAARGVGFLYAVAPNGATILTEALPAWARNPGRETEYDRMMALARARGINAIDLRPTLREAMAGGDVYFRYDSHWNQRGEVFGFNEIAARGGHPDWRVDPATAFAAPRMRVGGDLARLVGLGLDLRAEEPTSVVPVPPAENLAPTPHVATRVVSGRPGPVLLILGDSFAEHLFQQLPLPHAGAVIWVHHNRCAFDWAWIDRFKPDEVWWVTTERYMPCFDARPLHMPATTRSEGRGGG